MGYRFGPFVLDVEARRLQRHGTPVKLTPRAFDLLAALVARSPRALSSDDLRRTLWPDTWVGGTSLAQLVTELRKALGDRKQEPQYLRTVFRHGYAFCGEAREDPPAAGNASAAASAFEVVHGRRTIPLVEGENVIGREGHAHISLPTSLTSRRHARIVVTGSQACSRIWAARTARCSRGGASGHRPRSPPETRSGSEARC